MPHKNQKLQLQLTLYLRFHYQAQRGKLTAEKRKGKSPIKPWTYKSIHFSFCVNRDDQPGPSSWQEIFLDSGFVKCRSISQRFLLEWLPLYECPRSDLLLEALPSCSFFQQESFLHFVSLYPEYKWVVVYIDIVLKITDNKVTSYNNLGSEDWIYTWRNLLTSIWPRNELHLREEPALHLVGIVRRCARSRVLLATCFSSLSP